MQRRVIRILVITLTSAFLIGAAQAEDIVYPRKIAQSAGSLQETNFYTISIDPVVIPNATTLITAVSGSNVFIGDRPTRTLYLATVSGTNVILKQRIIVPAPLESSKNNALLDMVADKVHLYLAVADGANDYPSCGGGKIYEYAISALTKTPRRIFTSSPCAVGDLFYDARLALKGDEIFIAGGNSLVQYFDGTFPLPDSKDYVSGMTFPKTNYFGAVSSINLKTKKVSAVASGLRHLGGLMWDAERKVMWETENGPRGGDELNIIKPGKNYGWPKVTLGRPYDSERSGPGGVVSNSIGTSVAPVYGWTPSISPSTVRKVPAKGEFAKYWAGDLIVGSLKGNQLRRLRISPAKTVMYDEPIPVGDRIRTLDFLSDGRLILATDTGRIFILSNADVLGTGRYPKDPTPPAIG